MNESLRTGISFGLTSGIITTLGLMVGLSTGTQSRVVVIGGVLTIAIADAFSDALGIHISEEAEAKHTTREIWQSTIATFAAKFFFASAFIIPILILKLSTAIWTSIAIGLALLALFSYFIALQDKSPPLKVILEHVAIALVVIGATYYVGRWISATFGA
ncbi:MAG: VIT1/CCC1 transporter family protein [Candidatus Aquicultorales bacterium]